MLSLAFRDTDAFQLELVLFSRSLLLRMGPNLVCLVDLLKMNRESVRVGSVLGLFRTTLQQGCFEK